jgi:hypothetical protein
MASNADGGGPPFTNTLGDEGDIPWNELMILQSSGISEFPTTTKRCDGG